MKWKHFPRYWPLVRGIHRPPVNSPHKGQWRGALMVSLIMAWRNGWVYTGEAGDLRRHLSHYDVTVMNNTFYTYHNTCMFEYGFIGACLTLIVLYWQVIANCKAVGRPDGIYRYIVADMSDRSVPARVVDVSTDTDLTSKYISSLAIALDM